MERRTKEEIERIRTWLDNEYPEEVDTDDIEEEEKEDG